MKKVLKQSLSCFLSAALMVTAPGMGCYRVLAAPMTGNGAQGAGAGGVVTGVPLALPDLNTSGSAAIETPVLEQGTPLSDLSRVRLEGGGAGTELAAAIPSNLTAADNVLLQLRLAESASGRIPPALLRPLGGDGSSVEQIPAGTGLRNGAGRGSVIPIQEEGDQARSEAEQKPVTGEAAKVVHHAAGGPVAEVLSTDQGRQQQGLNALADGNTRTGGLTADAPLVDAVGPAGSVGLSETGAARLNGVLDVSRPADASTNPGEERAPPAPGETDLGTAFSSLAVPLFGLLGLSTKNAAAAAGLAALLLAAGAGAVYGPRIAAGITQRLEAARAETARREIEQQTRQLEAFASRNDGTIFYVPSMTFDAESLAAIRGIWNYESRILAMILALARNPEMRMVFVTSRPVQEAEIAQLLKNVSPEAAASIRSRVTFYDVGDSRSVPLTEKILMPKLSKVRVLLQAFAGTVSSRLGLSLKVQMRLRGFVDRLILKLARLLRRLGFASPHVRALRALQARRPGSPPAMMTPFISTELEWDLAKALGMPDYGGRYSLEYLGGKSGNKMLLEEVLKDQVEAGIPVEERVNFARAERDLHTEDEMIDGVIRLRKRLAAEGHSTPGRLMLKVNFGTSGGGNMPIDFDQEGVDWNQPLPQLREAIRTAMREGEFRGGKNWSLFRTMMRNQGALVEEFFEGMEANPFSPSGQGERVAGGEVVWLSAHAQILKYGNDYLGADSLDDPKLAKVIRNIVTAYGKRLAARGYFGRYALDFVMIKGKLYVVEANHRQGGTTHPYLLARDLTGAAFDPERGLLRRPDGRYIHYRAKDHDVRWNVGPRGGRPGATIQDMERFLWAPGSPGVVQQVAYDRTAGKEKGLVYNMPGGIENDNIAWLIIADSPAEREAYEAKVTRLHNQFEVWFRTRAMPSRAHELLPANYYTAGEEGALEAGGRTVGRYRFVPQGPAGIRARLTAMGLSEKKKDQRFAEFLKANPDLFDDASGSGVLFHESGYTVVGADAAAIARLEADLEARVARFLLGVRTGR